MRTLIILTIWLCTVCFIVTSDAQPPRGSPGRYKDYLSAQACQNCHDTIFDQYSESQHAKAFSDPLFQAQYFKEILPRAERDSGVVYESKHCLACHSPIYFIKRQALITSKEQVDINLSGVVCDFCHSIEGYNGMAPGNGNFISDPSIEHELGPLKGADNWHHVYSELQTKSEFCGICHNAVNHYGLEVKSTFTEWKSSEFAAKGIQCQDCHMNLKGFLQEGKPIYGSGWAANPASTWGVGGKYRSTLYTHRFPGAHSRTQISNALTITISVDSEKPLLSSGDEITIHVLVDNSRTGHKMPSGSKELRQMWLELAAYNGNKKISIPAVKTGVDAYDVAGKGPFDQEILGGDIPRGSRIYHAVFLDKAGKQTLSFYDAVKIIFDNRLNAAEIRKETFYFKIPADFKGKILLQANLNYLPYPSSLSNRLGLPNPRPFGVSSAKKELTLLMK